MAGPAGTFTADYVVTAVKRQFGDEAGVQINNADIFRWINAGCIEIVNKVQALQTTQVISGAAGTASYALPADVLNLDGVKYGDWAVTHTNTEEAAQTLGPSASNKGQPMFYWVYGNDISFYPVPEKAENITVRYRRYPARVSGLNDLLDLPDRYADRVIEYCMGEAYKLDEDWAAYSTIRQQFEDKLSEVKGAESTVSGSFQVITELDYEDEWYPLW